MNEATVKGRITKALRKRGAWYVMPHQRGYSRPGIPDIIALYRGKCVGVEVKFNGNKPTTHQLRELREIEAAGGSGMVLDETNWQEIETWLNACEIGN